MRNLLAVLAIATVGACATTRATPPTVASAPARHGFLRESSVRLVFFDGRASQQSGEQIKETITKQIAAAYPEAVVTRSDDSEYFSDPAPDRITLRIGIAAYSAAFGSKVAIGIGTFGGSFVVGVIPEGTWNGLVGLVTTIYDYRDGHEKKSATTISKLVSKPNTWGYKTADKALSESYQLAIQELLFFTDNALMK